MKRRFGIVAVSILTILVGLAGAGPAAAIAMNGPRIPLKESTSTNWSGYAVPQANVTDVKGTWVVPKVNSSSGSTYSSVWVGIDGYNSSTVEQTGTEQDWYNGAPRYYAWFEMYPKMPWIINHPVNQGDVMTAEVQNTGNKKYILTISDTTGGWSFTTTQTAGQAQRSSAEWIVEAPWSGGVLPLANFGTLSLTGAQAIIGGQTDTIGAFPNNTPITMVDPNGGTATPSALSKDGSSFSVTYSNP